MTQELTVNHILLTPDQLEVLKLTVGARLAYLRSRLEDRDMNPSSRRYLQWQLDELLRVEPMLDEATEATL